MLKEIELGRVHQEGYHEEENQPNNDGWIRYYDSENQAYYWYNNITGESVWDENYENDEYNHEGEENEEKDLLLTHSNHQLRDSSSVTSQNPTIHGDALYFWRFMYVNAIIVEAPLCVIEALVRVFILSSVYLILLAHFSIRYRDFRPVRSRLKILIRDIVLTLVAGSVLVIPGMILFLYRNFDPMNDWDLALLPTCVGPVDCRRFSMLTIFGSAALAKNVYDYSNANNSISEVWNDSVYFFPREVLSQLILLQRRSDG